MMMFRTMNSAVSSKVDVAAHLAFRVMLAALDWAVAAEETVAGFLGRRHKITKACVMDKQRFTCPLLKLVSRIVS